MRVINVGLKENSYRIYVGKKALEHIPSFVRTNGLGNYAVIVTTPTVYALHKKALGQAFSGIKHAIVRVAEGEEAKSKKWLLRLLREIVRLDSLKRRLFIVCFGGGAVGDLGGFLAAIYKRGIPYIQLPTTLLAQIDSSIGGKTAIDLNEAKNILGAFYQPRAVFIYPPFLKTLPSAQIKQGLAEVIKYGAIKDRNFFYFLKDNQARIQNLDSSCLEKVIATCAGIKAHIVALDEKESKGLRTILNFGHTFGHALESSLRYKKISHGEAISVGMRYAAYLSFCLGRCTKKEAGEITSILTAFSLPTTVRFNPLTIYKSLSYDKKFISGSIRMVLLRRIGRVEVENAISPRVIKKTLRRFAGPFVDI
jgi:3-dehydroquinate synthase